MYYIKDCLQIFKNNNLIESIIANDENLFAFDTVPTNNIASKFFVYNIDTNLWHDRLDHYYNNNNKNFVIKHTKNHNNKNCHQCKTLN